MAKAILFDIDGVLLDSFDVNLKYFQTLMRHFGYKEPTAKEFEQVFFLPHIDAVMKLTGLNRNEVKEINETGLAADFPYDIDLLHTPKDAAEVLRKLKTQYTLGIVTSRTRNDIFNVKDLAAIKECFAVVVTYDDTSKHKPEPEPLLFAAKKLKVKPGECVYIGDAETDKQAAEAAGMKAIIFARTAAGDIKVDTRSFSEIPKLIESL